MTARDLGVGGGLVTGDDADTAAHVARYRAELIADSHKVRWTGVVLGFKGTLAVPISAMVGVRPDAMHVQRIMREHKLAIAATGEGLDVLWQYSAMWVGHKASDCWVGVTLRYPTIGAGVQLAFNALRDRPLLRAAVDSGYLAWTLGPRLTDDTAMYAMACEVERDKLGPILADVDARATIGEKTRPTRPLQVLRPRSRDRRSTRPHGPGGMPRKRR